MPVVQDLWWYFPCYTSDMWIGTDGSKYIGLQLHVIDTEWKYLSLITGARMLPPSLDALRIAQSIDSSSWTWALMAATRFPLLQTLVAT